MSEIKFACPHCSQHIACDGGYSSLCIECPSCGDTMLVPRTTSDSAHSGMVLVASTPSKSPVAQIPTLEGWTEAKWEKNYQDLTGEPSMPSPLWIVSLFISLGVAFVLMTKGFGRVPIFGSLLVFGILTGILRARSRGSSGAESAMSGLAFGVALMILTPILALGTLFLGCLVCSGG